MQKFENVAEVGDRIKAMDFVARSDSYVTGKVIEKGLLTSSQGPRFMAYKIVCEESLMAGRKDKSRIGCEVLVQMETSFMEFNGRVTQI